MISYIFLQDSSQDSPGAIDNQWHEVSAHDITYPLRSTYQWQQPGLMVWSTEYNSDGFD